MAKGTPLTDAQKAAKQAEKAATFKKLANQRIAKALDAIARLRPLANKGNYAYTDEQVTNMVKALEGGVVKLADTFKGGTTEPVTAEFV